MSIQNLLTLSVIVPCYNEADNIRHCLDALTDQKEMISEIVIVDNNSSDNSVGIIDSYSEQFPFIKYVLEREQGLTYARNAGLTAATGDVLARIDADTVIDPGWAEALLSYYSSPENEKIGAASGRCWYYDLPFRKLTTRVLDSIIKDFNRTSSGTSHSMYGANMSLKREAWRKISDKVCNESGLMEDMDVGFHVSDAGYGIGHIKNATAGVSGRRMRMSPLRYWKYNRQWWMTYQKHGLAQDARRTRVFCWFGNILQALVWVGLLFHNPETDRFGIIPRIDKGERPIP